MKKLNLNSFVKVQLTNHGSYIFYHQYDALNKQIVARGGTPIEPHHAEVDSDGYTRMQLWEYMNIFGPHMVMGGVNVTKTMDIYIDDEDLEEV